LTAINVNSFIDWLKKITSSSAMIKGRRGPVLMLLRYAQEMQIAPPQNGRIRKVRVQRNIPTGWRVEEVQKLLETCLAQDVRTKSPDAQKGHHMSRIHNHLSSGPRVGLMLAGIVSVAWDTTLRLGDILAMKWSDVEFDSQGTARAHIVMSKTGYLQSVTISKETIEILRQIEAAMDGPTKLLLPWPYRREKLYDWVRCYVREAGIRKGTLKFLRSGSASAAEKLERGAGKSALGHRSDWISAAHYLDPSIVGIKDIARPSLFAKDPVNEKD